MPMPASRNPFQYGSPVTQSHFTDRAEDLELLTTSMLEGQNLVLIAPRRFGKTSLLLAAIHRVRDKGGATGRVNLIKCSRPRDVAEELMRGVLDGPMGWAEGRLADLGRRLRALRVTVEIKVDPETLRPEGIQLGGAASTTDWRLTIAEVIRSLHSLARSEKKRVSFVMDEFQKVKEIQDDLPDVFKELVDELEGVSLVFAGSRRHMMEEIASGPLYDVGLKHTLRRIKQDDFVEFLVSRARQAGKPMTPALAATIYELANGIPNDVQLLAFWAFHFAGRSVDDQAVAAGLGVAVGSQKDTFKNMFQELAPAQQRLLKLIAAESEQPQAP